MSGYDAAKRRFYSPRALDKFTTRPLAFLTRGRKVFVTSISPHRLTSAARLDFVSGVHSIGAVKYMPALLTNPHRPKIRTNNRRHPYYLKKSPLSNRWPLLLTLTHPQAIRDSFVNTFQITFSKYDPHCPGWALP